MSLVIAINSSNYINNTTNQFQVNLPNNYEIKPDSEICISQCTIPNSFYNVIAGQNNYISYIMPCNNVSLTGTTSGLSTSITLTLNSGNLALGQLLIASGVPSGTYIISQQSGTALGTGIYTLSQAINVSSLAITSISIWTDVYLNSGCYQISDINSALQASMRANGFYFYNNTSTLMPSGSNTSNLYANIVYPITLTTTTASYSNTFSFLPICNSTGNNTSVIGTGFIWNSTLPSTITFPQIAFNYQSNISTNNLANLLGFYCQNSPSFFPATAATLASITLQNSVPLLVSGNSLSAQPSYPALGSRINGIIVRCSLTDNQVQSNGVSDILDSFAITSGYGSNINYLPVSNNYVKCKSGKFNNFIISFYDQNLNQLGINDRNINMTLLLMNGKL